MRFRPRRLPVLAVNMVVKKCASTVAGDVELGQRWGGSMQTQPVEVASRLGAGPFRDAVSCAPSKALGGWFSDIYSCSQRNLMMSKKDASHVRCASVSPSQVSRVMNSGPGPGIGAGDQERRTQPWANGL